MFFLFLHCIHTREHFTTKEEIIPPVKVVCFHQHSYTAFTHLLNSAEAELSKLNCIGCCTVVMWDPLGILAILNILKHNIWSGQSTALYWWVFRVRHHGETKQDRDSLQKNRYSTHKEKPPGRLPRSGLSPQTVTWSIFWNL